MEECMKFGNYAKSLQLMGISVQMLTMINNCFDPSCCIVACSRIFPSFDTIFVSFDTAQKTIKLETKYLLFQVDTLASIISSNLSNIALYVLELEHQIFFTSLYFRQAV